MEQAKKELAEKTETLATRDKQYTQLLVRETLPVKTAEWVARLQERNRQKAERIVTQVLQGPITDGKQVDQALHAHGYTLLKLDRGNDSSRAANSSPVSTSDGVPKWTTLSRAVAAGYRTNAIPAKQARRHELAQDSKALHAVIQASDLQQAKHFGLLLEQAGANVWQL